MLRCNPSSSSANPPVAPTSEGGPPTIRDSWMGVGKGYNRQIPDEMIFAYVSPTLVR
jgi:hypothetical protein